MTREQLEDAVKCTTKTHGCKDCTFPSDNDHGCFELLATEALAQLDRAEKWKAIAERLYDNMGHPIPGDREQYTAAYTAYEQAMEQEAGG